MNSGPFDIFSEAVSNYITFAAGIVFGLIAWAVQSWFRRKRPSVVRMELTDSASLLEVAPVVRNELHIAYQGNTITELHQATFHIFNRGENIVDNVQLSLMIKAENALLKSALTDPISSRQSTLNVGTVTMGKAEIGIAIPFLNPYKDFHDSLVVRIYAPQKVEVEGVSGGGRGWTSEFADRAAYLSDVQEAVSNAAFGMIYQVPIVGPLVSSIARGVSVSLVTPRLPKV